jgi:FkbM family methyltransferase
MLPTAAALVEKLPRVLRRHRLMTAWMKLTGEDPVQLVRIRDNDFAYADMNEGFLRLIVIDQDFEEDFFRVADPILGNGGTFLDVGANYGLLSFGLAGKFGAAIDFHLFEPNGRLLAAILRSRRLYPEMRANLVQAAVSDLAGETRFSVDESHTGASHIDEGGELIVRTLTLDGYLDERGIEKVALMKMDIEGYELRAFKGAAESLRTRRIGAIYFEHFQKNAVRAGAPEDVLALLDAGGYTVCFCRKYDLDSRGGGSHTIAGDLAGHGLPLLPVEGQSMPPGTDLLAVPAEHLATI